MERAISNLKSNSKTTLSAKLEPISLFQHFLYYFESFNEIFVQNGQSFKVILNRENRAIDSHMFGMKRHLLLFSLEILSVIYYHTIVSATIDVLGWLLRILMGDALLGSLLEPQLKVWQSRSRNFLPKVQ